MQTVPNPIPTPWPPGVLAVKARGGRVVHMAWLSLDPTRRHARTECGLLNITDSALVVDGEGLRPCQSCQRSLLRSDLYERLQPVGEPEIDDTEPEPIAGEVTWRMVIDKLIETAERLQRIEQVLDGDDDDPFAE